MTKNFKSTYIDTPLGAMIAAGDDQSLYLLKFADACMVNNEIEQLSMRVQAVITPGHSAAIASIEAELNAYFQGTLTSFKTPLALFGTPFQKSVWKKLMQLPYGHTRSYLELSHAVARPQACRAVGSANGANKLAIVIPCHRIISNSGDLGGYAGGLDKKKWLIEHEGTYAK